MSQSPTIIKFKYAPSLANIVKTCKENPGLKTVYLNHSAMTRTSKTTFELCDLLGITVKEAESRLGRPKFNETPQLVEECQRLKDSGIGLTRASKKLGIPESTLYVHVWKKLR